ncbi:DUF4129 domain-containing protein [Pyxidicoccus parkwayensis]|uniref:DUF4129 domain-containing protein n=1 Tax=Pyxidicoccus parkwayensis TaxID=2813578 RepID=A0ABX7PCK4_9BACT|nr:DUF4129 domain-containing protein [Pyxidicoccus parkwaysis]QSQ28172.1 DUF4129 domain-containing protein [Pyxidicoccus parkwaysis]
MTSIPLLMLLTTLPCADRERTSRLLEETAASRPSELPAVVDGLAARMGGMPLPAVDKDASAVERAKQLTGFLERACALEEAEQRVPDNLPASEPERLKAILDRPEFSHARQRHGDLLKRLMRELEAWMEGLFESNEAQSFAVATRAVMLGLAFALVLWGVLRFAARLGRKAATVLASTQAEVPLVLDSPGEHLRRAHAALSSDARTAIREGLLGMLSALEQRRLARPDRVRTNRELAAELPARGAPATVVSEVERLVRWYDRAFYSLAPVPADEAASFVAAVEHLNGSLPAESSR